MHGDERIRVLVHEREPQRALRVEVGRGRAIREVCEDVGEGGDVVVEGALHGHAHTRLLLQKLLDHAEGRVADYQRAELGGRRGVAHGGLHVREQAKGAREAARRLRRPIAVVRLTPTVTRADDRSDQIAEAQVQSELPVAARRHLPPAGDHGPVPRPISLPQIVAPIGRLGLAGKVALGSELLRVQPVGLCGIRGLLRRGLLLRLLIVALDSPLHALVLLLLDVRLVELRLQIEPAVQRRHQVALVLPIPEVLVTRKALLAGELLLVAVEAGVAGQVGQLQVDGAAPDELLEERLVAMEDAAPVLAE
mmetsp:Transcript_39924/g.95554  ORF Transcript_39924/g.95554 Transcript_39924/m.95554 type:complete len:308 (+) Transcript_39924:427-1350(+)